MSTVTLPAPASGSAPLRVALVGNPNTGKTTVFNALCGLRAKTSNYPGTTTSIRMGTTRNRAQGRLEVVDLPGLYDLNSQSPESVVASRILEPGSEKGCDVVLVIVDACNLARNLVLVGEILAQHRPVVVALNMMDAARSRGIHIDHDLLSQRLHCPVIPIVARRGEGLEGLREAVASASALGLSPIDVPPAGATTITTEVPPGRMPARLSSSAAMAA